MSSAVVDAIHEAVREAGSTERAAGAKAYLKSDLSFFGVPNPELRKIVRGHIKALGKLERSTLVEIVEGLWAPPIHELRMAAVQVLEFRGKKLLEADDIALLERLLRESRTWALVDTIAVNVVGPVVEREELGATLDRWATDEDFWIRRSAMLALLRPLRAGGGDFARFARYADATLDEKEFFIRKAIGWILRETGRKRPELVDEFIAPRTHRASGVTMREAVKVLPKARAEELMRAYREKRPAS